MTFSNLPTLRASPKQTVLACGATFLVALGVRLVLWHDARHDAGKVQSVVAADYQRTAKLFREAGVAGFFSSSGPLADPNFLGHPPGYPIVRAVLASLFGDSDAVVQFFQITCDAFAAVVIFLIAIELLPLAVGGIAGLLAAFSPQFAWNSGLLLPDTLAVLPILLALYLFTRALKAPSLISMICAGVCVGLSCWLRANALLMAPFLAMVALLLFSRKWRLQYAGALLFGAVLVIAPMTIRNWIVFQHFIPISLGAGQTMLEGIADYDPTRRFGIPDTDMAIMKMEADQYNRPDYYSTLFAPDGIKRERLRLARGFSVMRDHPVWFGGVMIRRAGSMLRLERSRLISIVPPVTRNLEVDARQRVWMNKPVELLSHLAEKSSTAQLFISDDGERLQVISDGAKYGVQFKTSPVAVKRGHDYLFRFPAMVEEGRMTANATGANQTVYGSVVIEKAEVKEGDRQPEKIVDVPFVSTGDEAAVLFKNAAPASGRSVIQVGSTELYDLGPASFLWTRYPRWLVNNIQKVFITAVIFPLSFFGLVILAKRRAWKTLIILLSVPVYYFCFQSMLHTEYRYVLAIHYFLFVLAAVTVYEAGRFVSAFLNRRRQPARV